MDYFYYTYLNNFQVKNVIMHKLNRYIYVNFKWDKNDIGFGQPAHYFYISDILCPKVSLISEVIVLYSRLI